MELYFLLIYGVNSPGIERVATYNAPGCHQTTLENAIFIYRLVSIMRTGWIKSTCIGRHNTRDGHLIKADKSQ
jgi:hypothetical protein